MPAAPTHGIASLPFSLSPDCRQSHSLNFLRCLLALEGCQHLTLPRLEGLLLSAALCALAHAPAELTFFELTRRPIAQGLHMLSDRALKFAELGRHRILWVRDGNGVFITACDDGCNDAAWSGGLQHGSHACMRTLDPGSKHAASAQREIRARTFAPLSCSRSAATS